MNVTIKAERINFCESINKALTKQGYSTVKVVNAVNGELQRAKLVNGDSTATTGYFSNQEKKGVAKATVKASLKLETRVNIVTRFDAWCKAIEAAQKVSGNFILEIPEYFTVWLNKLHNSKTGEEMTETEETTKA